jgi:hypothetical protein
MHLLEQGLHLCDHIRVFRVARQVVQLLGVVVVVVEFLPLLAEGPFRVPPTLGPDAVAGIVDAALDLDVGGVTPLGFVMSISGRGLKP